MKLNLGALTSSFHTTPYGKLCYFGAVVVVIVMLIVIVIVVLKKDPKNVLQSF